MMNGTIDERIGRYLAGEADTAEREALEKEMATNPSIYDQFLISKQIWEASHSLPQSNWDAEKGWDRFRNENSVIIPLTNKNRTSGLSWAIAAAVMLAFGAAVFLWYDRLPAEYAYDPAASGMLTLEDGSRIHFNEGASAKVYSFKKDIRKIELSGEAFFEVNPDDSKPFIVKAGKTLTEVVGTSFNINQTENRTSIFVTSGKVIFRSLEREDGAIALTAGEAAVFQDNQLKRVVNPSSNMHAWHTRELKFGKNMAFGDIIADIGTYFKQDFVFENENVKKCLVTIPLSFKEPELSSILESVVASVNAQYTIEGKKCIIRGGENCF